MSSESIDLLLTLDSNTEEDPEWLDRQARELLNELRELDLESAQLAKNDSILPGAKAAAMFTPGALAVTVAPKAIQELFGFIESWCMRSRSHIVRIQIGTDTIEFAADRSLSPDEMIQLIDRLKAEHEGKQYTILFLAADPTDAERLRLGEEVREIQQRLQLATMRDHFKLELRMAVRPGDLSQALLDTKPRIVHFAGHGTNTGELCFQDELGQMKIVSVEALADLFALEKKSVDCVILNACFSELQAKTIASHVPYVIGMSTEISDNAALFFVVGFYQAIGAGKPIDEAFRYGCAQIRLQGFPEDLTPVLISQ
ncbi:MAG: CHAT domain-containing protein [Caldilineaceae bacterium]